MRIIWSPIAKSKVNEIIEYIAKDDLKSALHLIEQFEIRVKDLRENPKLGRILSELKNEQIREIVVHKNYGIIYEIKPNVIEILTVRHFRQDFTT